MNSKPNSGSFKKGVSGNTSGRPAGLSSARAKFRKVVGDRIDEIAEKLTEMALAGDTAAATVILSRLVPPVKPTAESLKVKHADTLTDQGHNIVLAMTAGTTAPDTAMAAMAVLTAQSKLVEQDDLVQRIEQLEHLCGTAKG